MPSYVTLKYYPQLRLTTDNGWKTVPAEGHTVQCKLVILVNFGISDVETLLETHVTFKENHNTKFHSWWVK